MAAARGKLFSDAPACRKKCTLRACGTIPRNKIVSWPCVRHSALPFLPGRCRTCRGCDCSSSTFLPPLFLLWVAPMASSQRLRNHASRDARPKSPPPCTSRTAAGVVVCFTSSFYPARAALVNVRNVPHRWKRRFSPFRQFSGKSNEYRALFSVPRDEARLLFALTLRAFISGFGLRCRPRFL